MSGLPERVRAFYAGHRREAADLGWLCLSFLLSGALIAPMPLGAALGTLVVASLWPVAAGGLRGHLLGVARKLAVAAVAVGLLVYWRAAALTPVWFAAFWIILPWLPGAVAALASKGRAPFSRLCGSSVRVLSVPPRPEILRCALLASGTLWLMRGFARPTLNGTNDALWYGTMLADMMAQVRAGVFPVWTGQSIYQFNGSIYPLRVAPAFHYLGALLDTLTLHSLHPFSLQNLLIIVVSLCATASAYFCIRRLLPSREWAAAGLAVLFISCPGVIGIAYNMDLFMSWTTVPAIPIVWYATVRSFQNRGQLRTMLLLGASLGYCWWGHSPIAIWSTLLAFAAQAARITVQWRGGVAWANLLFGAVAFGLISAYPVGSVLFFPPEPGIRADSFQQSTAGTIVYFIQQVFPGTFLPVSSLGRSLSDFQVGYGLWAVLIVSIWILWRRRASEAAVPIALAVAVAVLLLPTPHVDLWIWSAMPAFIRNANGNWAMNRLYLPLAGAIVFGAAATLAGGLSDDRRRRRAFAVAIALGCAWSLLEARKFGDGSNIRRPVDSAVDQMRPENVMLTRFAYFVFPKPPSTFTHGVMDPELENNLLAPATLLPVATNLEAALKSGRPSEAASFTGDDGAGGGYIGLGRSLRIEAGRRYLLSFDFLHPEVPGVLQISGPHFYREYALPEFGGERAFGAGGKHAKAVPIWTTAGTEDLTVHFVPVPPIAAGTPSPEIGRVSLIEFQRDALPVRVDSWIPYRARVRSPAAAWLETPRMFQTGYAATVNRAPADVRKSPDGLVCVAVPGGESVVELRYVAPLGLQSLFWISLLSLFGFAAAGAAAMIRRDS